MIPSTVFHLAQALETAAERQMAKKVRKLVVIEEEDILDRLRDLLKQATTERSHYYVAKCCRDAIEEIERLRRSCGET